MNKQRKAKRTGSKKAAAKPRRKPSGPWNLRITPELRLSAQGFHAALLRIHTREGGESPPPSIGSLDARLKFQFIVAGSRAVELIQMIGAASEEHFAADAVRYNRLFNLVESLREKSDKEENAASTTSSKRAWDKLLSRVFQLQLQLDDLGEPPYGNSENDGAEGLPDFMSIWRERERYTTQLAQLEEVSSELEIDVNELGPKPPGGVRAPRGLAPLPIESSSNEVTVSVNVLLGGPLAEWVSKIGRSVSHTGILNMKPRWRDLGVAYCELHLKSGLMDFEALGIEGGEENPFWDEARALLSQAQRHLLDFLKAACEFDNPPALAEPRSKAQATAVEKPHVEPTSKAKEARVRKRKLKPSAAKKPGPKIVRIERTLLTGSPLKVLVDEVPVRSNAVPTIKVLLAICILIKKHPRDQFLKTEDLKRLALTKDELEDPNTKRIPQLRGNWKRSLQSPHGIHLEFKEHSDRFRLRNAKFQTSLSSQVVEDALTKFKTEHPIQRGKRKPSS